MDDIISKLEAEYCPPLDPALLSAIVSDFDLTSETNVQEARNVLDSLKESAILEEAAGFDAAGTGARDEEFISATRPDSCPDTSGSASRETDLTSLTNGVSSVDLASEDGHKTPSNSGVAEDLENESEEIKVSSLEGLFHDRVSRSKIQYTLKKCQGNWHAAFDELLTQAYFEEAEHSEDGGKIAAKGIDAFSEENNIYRGRKKKSKSKRLKSLDARRASSLPVSPTDSGPPPENQWQHADKDIDYIVSRTGLPSANVYSVYHHNGASLSRTIGAVLKDNLNAKSELEDDPIVAVNVHELGEEFPTIAFEYRTALVRLTYPSTAAAHDLAKSLTTKPKGSAGGIQVVPNYIRPTVDDTDESWSKISGRSLRSSRDASPIDEPVSTDRLSVYAAARNAALSQAYAAHRKSKSDRLMGGAAAYYGQLGRDYAALSSKASAAAADQLVSSQSTRSQLDLHGVDVLNAVRIAQDKVEQWWDGLGEYRVNGRRGADERQAGYSIVVGLGRHSEGGRSKLGPAVTKALRQIGWNVEHTGAIIVVKGKTRP